MAYMREIVSDVKRPLAGEGRAISRVVGNNKRGWIKASAAALLSATMPWCASAQTYVPDVSTLSGNDYSSSAYVVLGGYYYMGDGGGGTLVKSASGCTANGGTNFNDHIGTCFNRSGSADNVRQWGAHCDVFAIQNPGSVNWKPGIHGGSIVVDNSALPAVGTPQYPQPNEFIAASQIGGPTLWVRTSGTAAPAVWATRFSVLDTTSTSGYKAGDLVSFSGSTSGSFSQQIAVIVDSTTTNGATTGVIAQWHYLWGGLYDPAHLPSSPMLQDISHSVTSGTGATFTPHWSGWSLLNSQNISTAGTTYSVGSVITLSGAGGVVNQGHSPKLVVESVNGSNGVVAYDWLDYGSFSTLPTDTTTLTDAAGGTATFAISPVAWTRGPFATTIKTVVTDSDTSKLDIVLTDAAPFPANLKIQYVYYGHDDGDAINKALGYEQPGTTAAGDASAITLPAGCGTTVPVVLPQDATPNYVSPALVGTNLQSTGLYAFAQPLAHRTESSGDSPVLNRMIYNGFANTSGGGVRNMLVEGLGIPEGYGYYGLADPGYMDPNGYIGPTHGDATYNVPSAGDLIEVDGGKYMRLENLHVTDGGIGPGNSIVHCGVDESDPTNVLNSAHVGNIIVADSRFDGTSQIAGATNPDFGLRIGNSCHDSIYRALSVYDGTTADILQYNGNLFSQIHLNSDAANSPSALQSVTWPTGTILAGVANYGFYTIGNTSIAQTQCDISNNACIRLAVNSAGAVANPAQITDTQVKCGSLASVWPTYYGVELSTGATNTTVSGTASASTCTIPPSQLIHLDGSIDPSVSLCNNSNALMSACAIGNGFATNRWYTQPTQAYTTSAPIASGSLYAIPFSTPVGGVATQIGVQVTTPGTSALCELGVYNSQGGVPGSLLLDSGHITAVAVGMKKNFGLNFTLAANTLYFLTVGCNTAIVVEGTTSASPLTAPLVGAGDFVTLANTSLTTAWSYGTTGALPAKFGAVTYTPSTITPNVYVGP